MWCKHCRRCLCCKRGPKWVHPDGNICMGYMVLLTSTGYCRVSATHAADETMSQCRPGLICSLTHTGPQQPPAYALAGRAWSATCCRFEMWRLASSTDTCRQETSGEKQVRNNMNHHTSHKF